ncbi:hypothetical protein Q31b_41960 [Novipirellula aureliae]|uniref:Uncharacterized protein n=1 Tax=Novipirellula aureliae TaxID=2527966 RepID=A0A5C6DP86_9BACT|nr:hypothetical protein Q31b_41960 [Novipirellula aureliae]
MWVICCSIQVICDSFEWQLKLPGSLTPKKRNQHATPNTSPPGSRHLPSGKEAHRNPLSQCGGADACDSGSLGDRQKIVAVIGVIVAIVLLDHHRCTLRNGNEKRNRRPRYTAVPLTSQRS